MTTIYYNEDEGHVCHSNLTHQCFGLRHVKYIAGPKTLALAPCCLLNCTVSIKDHDEKYIYHIYRHNKRI
ncbi:hypothetical protein VIGAN_04283300 [Vigna angularis var. angularis]|uniref:Uncharacterized protein n=1 Tax=Vigna angularis var. angularis TaxID=157739 RepID=A0A0S3RXN7_PHAAN|nr:hypothetical protein VIGAN_04283300 [Vigna angularis var. angularis]